MTTMVIRIKGRVARSDNIVCADENHDAGSDAVGHCRMSGSVQLCAHIGMMMIAVQLNIAE